MSTQESNMSTSATPTETASLKDDLPPTEIIYSEHPESRKDAVSLGDTDQPISRQPRKMSTCYGIFWMLVGAVSALIIFFGFHSMIPHAEVQVVSHPEAQPDLATFEFEAQLAPEMPELQPAQAVVHEDVQAPREPSTVPINGDTFSDIITQFDGLMESEVFDTIPQFKPTPRNSKLCESSYLSFPTYSFIEDTISEVFRVAQLFEKRMQEMADLPDMGELMPTSSLFEEIALGACDMQRSLGNLRGQFNRARDKALEFLSSIHDVVLYSSRNDEPLRAASDPPPDLARTLEVFSGMLIFYIITPAETVILDLSILTERQFARSQVGTWWSSSPFKYFSAQYWDSLREERQLNKAIAELRTPLRRLYSLHRELDLLVPKLGRAELTIDGKGDGVVLATCENRGGEIGWIAIPGCETDAVKERMEYAEKFRGLWEVIAARRFPDEEWEGICNT